MAPNDPLVYPVRRAQMIEHDTVVVPAIFPRTGQFQLTDSFHTRCELRRLHAEQWALARCLGKCRVYGRRFVLVSHDRDFLPFTVPSNLLIDRVMPTTMSSANTALLDITVMAMAQA